MALLDTSPCNLVHRYQHFILRAKVEKMQAASSTVTMEMRYQTACSHIPKNCNSDTGHHYNLKFHMLTMLCVCRILTSGGRVCVFQ